MRHAPVLLVGGVFDPDLCRGLISHFNAAGGETFSDILSVNGKPVIDAKPDFKDRSDVTIKDQGLVGRCRWSLETKLLPLIAQTFHFNVTNIERYLVGCYAAETGGHMGPHRDNIAPFTMHRKFALSVGLNGDYDGGGLRFPDWGSEYKLDAGEAAVFSCSLLHEVSRVVSGKRYAFLSFFYDTEGARIRYAVDAQTQMLNATQTHSGLP